MNELLVCSEKMEVEKETAEGISADAFVKDDVKRGVSEAEVASPQMTLQATEIVHHVEDLGKVRTIKDNSVVEILQPFFHYRTYSSDREFMRRDQREFKMPFSGSVTMGYRCSSKHDRSSTKHPSSTTLPVFMQTKMVKLRGDTVDTRMLRAWAVV